MGWRVWNFGGSTLRYGGRVSRERAIQFVGLQGAMGGVADEVEQIR
jgi:hypothetical protein